MKYRFVDREHFLGKVALSGLKPYHEDVAEFSGESLAVVREKAAQTVAMERATWKRTVTAHTPADHAAYYGATASYLYRHVDADRERYSRYELFLAPFLRGRRYLDFGCGVGCMSLWCAKLNACFVTAADLPSRHFDFARFRFEKYAVPVKTVIPAANSIYPDLDDMFDTIFSLSTFEHLLDWKGHLAFFRERLAAGGRLILKVDYDHGASPEHITDVTGLTPQTLNEEMRRLGLVQTLEEPIGLCRDSFLHIFDADVT